MASRQVRCNQCGSVLMVPAAAVRVVECRVCHGMNQIRPSTGPWSQVYNSFHQFGGRLRSFVNTIMPGSVNRNPGYYYGTTPQLGYYPQPLRPSYNVFGPKRAVLCGIRYHGQDSQQLNGTVNDVKNMNMFLVKYCGFPRESILILTDDMEERDPLKFPTKYNIQMAMRWLIEGSQSGDSLVFHFAGHGAQEPDMSGDELDRSDEVICPVDSREQGNILDDEINATIVRPLPRGAKLHAVIDSCHSGTVLDLAFVCKMNREGYYTWEDQRCPRTDKGTRGGLAICISACEDGQTSIDTSALSGNEATGALTYSFIQTVQNEPGLSYGRLLSAMRSTIRGTKTGIVQLNGPIASLLNRLLGLDLRQEPQLSSSEMFDVYTKRFVL